MIHYPPPVKLGDLDYADLIRFRTEEPACYVGTVTKIVPSLTGTYRLFIGFEKQVLGEPTQIIFEYNPSMTSAMKGDKIKISGTFFTFMPGKKLDTLDESCEMDLAKLDPSINYFLFSTGKIEILENETDDLLKPIKSFG